MSGSGEQLGSTELEGYAVAQLEVFGANGEPIEFNRFTTGVYRYPLYPEMNCVYVAQELFVDGSSAGLCYYESPELMCTLEQLGFDSHVIEEPDQDDIEAYQTWLSDNYDQGQAEESSDTNQPQTDLNSLDPESWDIPKIDCKLAYYRNGTLFELSLKDTRVFIISHNDGAMTHLLHKIKEEGKADTFLYIFEPEKELLEQLAILQFTTTYSRYPTEYQLERYHERTARILEQQCEDFLRLQAEDGDAS
jgi:hypothetical protein